MKAILINDIFNELDLDQLNIELKNSDSIVSIKMLMNHKELL